MEVIMEEKHAFQTDKAAITGGPYSQATIHNGLIYTSGQGAIDPKTNQISLGLSRKQTKFP